MINYFMMKEAIASTEIETGPIDPVEKRAMMVFAMANGAVTMKEARVIAEWMEENNV